MYLHIISCQFSKVSQLIGMSLSLAKVLRLLLTRGGIEKNPGPTNGETLEWLKSLSSEKYSESNLEAAKTFLNGFVGGRKMFGSWREKFLSGLSKDLANCFLRSK